MAGTLLLAGVTTMTGKGGGLLKNNNRPHVFWIIHAKLMYNRNPGKSLSLIRLSLWVNDTVGDAFGQLRHSRWEYVVCYKTHCLSALAGGSQARVKASVFRKQNKQGCTVELRHFQILWQIHHQLATDVICIRDYCNLRISGKQPNLVSDGRCDFQFAFREGTGDPVGSGMGTYRETRANILRTTTPSL